MSQKSGAAYQPTGDGFTEKQGQYLAFIYTYAAYSGHRDRRNRINVIAETAAR
jgi:hypothetical protein